jgi:hypothetical protein
VTAVMDDSCISTSSRIVLTVEKTSSKHFGLKSKLMKGKKTAQNCVAAEEVPV